MVNIYEKSKAGVQYSFIINELSKTKVPPDIKGPQLLCRVCANKLDTAHEVKILIEKTQLILNKMAKRYVFNDISDIDIKNTHVELGSDSKSEDICLNFSNGISSVYHNTRIVKIVTDKSQDDVENQTLNVMDSLEGFNDDGNDNGDDDSDFNAAPSAAELSDSDALPLRTVKRRNRARKKKKYKGEIEEDSDWSPPTYLKKKQRSENQPKKRRQPKFNPNERGEMRRVHLQPLHPRPPRAPAPPAPPARAVCPRCGRVLRAASLRAHMMLHTDEKKHPCAQCGKRFWCAAALATHAQRHAPPRHACPRCVAVFHDAGTLARHMVSHSNVKKFVCDICQKAFKYKSGWQRHVSAHAGARARCAVCGAALADARTLRHHMRVHTGERPYNCQLCSQPYSYKHDFNRHCWNKHGVFLKRRDVSTLDAGALAAELALRRELVLRAHGLRDPARPPPAFRAPQGHLAYRLALAAYRALPPPADDGGEGGVEGGAGEGGDV